MGHLCDMPFGLRLLLAGSALALAVAVVRRPSAQRTPVAVLGRGSDSTAPETWRSWGRIPVPGGGDAVATLLTRCDRDSLFYRFSIAPVTFQVAKYFTPRALQSFRGFSIDFYDAHDHQRFHLLVSLLAFHRPQPVAGDSLPLQIDDSAPCPRATCATLRSVELLRH
jgi:hypothetical protein